MKFVECILLLILLITGISAPLQKNSFLTVILFATFCLVMSVIWMLLQAPDLAITEAAVGAGITSLLLFVTLKKIHAIDLQKSNAEKEGIDHGEDQI